MAKTIEELEKELAEANKIIEAYKKPSEFRGFYTYNRVINSQIDILEEFDLATQIKTPVTKDDKYYERVETIIEKLPSHLSKINTLKSELNITGNEKKDTDKNIPFIESVATKRD